MKDKLRKPTALLAAAAIAAPAVPMFAASASAAEVGTTWRFDFGPQGQTVESGYYGVDPSTEYNANSADGIRFGLYGQNENDYKLGNYEDGVTVKQGQVVSYAGSGTGSSADADRLGIGSLGSDQIPGIYPVRFAMDAENNSYYEVKVNVTTLDSSRAASGVFVYSERRHPIVTNQTIAAGSTQTVTFRATVQSVLLKDRTNGGDITYRDSKLNVSVMGDNAAVSSIEVTKIDPSTTRTIWCYNDSTGCDYPMALPYFPLQNYGGTAQYLSKYLPNDIALVNQGDGGLASGASSYFNVCKNNFKAGDYVYLQYGHNESSASGYLNNLPTYYKFAHSKGANMVYAGPIDRHNASQYNASANTWSSTLNGYSRAAKAYTEVLICAGPDAGDTFVSKAKTSMEDAYAYADSIIEGGITSAGVTDVAFVDLNAPTLSWLSLVCDEVKTIKGASDYKATYSDYYFRSAKGTTVDGTHENDYGADATASFFFDGIAAKANSSSAIEQAEYNVLSPLITNMRTAYGSWDHVTADVINAGSAPNSAWPDVFRTSSAAAFPTSVKGITWNSDGTVASVSILKQESVMAMDDYGKLKLDIYDSNNTLKGSIGSSQVDNTWSDGTTTVYYPGEGDNRLDGDTSTVYDKAAGDTFTATIYRASKGDGSQLNYLTPFEAYSETYIPTDYEGALITNEDGAAGEDFNFYGALFDGTSSAADRNGWKLNGSASRSANLYQDGNTHYMKAVTGSSGSMNLSKGFESSPAVKSNGRLHMSVDLRNASGTLQFTLASNYKANWPDGQTLNVFTLSGNKVLVNGTSSSAGDVSGSAWQTVTADIDLDRGTISVKTGDRSPVTVNVSGLQKNFDYAPTSLSGLCIAKSGNYEGSVDIANLSIDKYSPADDLPSRTLTIEAAGGAVKANGTETTSVSAPQSSAIELKAVPADFYTFTNWTDADGNVLSTEATYTYPRLYSDAAIHANFTSIYGEGYEVSYVNGFRDDFEGETNIFNGTDVVDTTTINANTVFGKVLRLSGKSFDLSAELASPLQIGANQYFDLSFNQFTPYIGNEKDIVFSLNDSSGNEIVSYAYNPGSTSVTSVKIGGAAPEEFSPFSWSTANSWNDENKTKYDFTKSTNPGLVSIRVNGNKTVSIKFENNNGKETKQYSGTLTDSVTINKIRFIKENGQNNIGRTVGLDNFNAVLVNVPAEKYAYTINAVDENGSIIKQLSVGSAAKDELITVNALHEIIKDEQDNYYQLSDPETNDYTKTFTMDAAESTGTVLYHSKNNVVFYAEGESADGTNAKYSGGGSETIAAQNKVGRGKGAGTLPAGSYKVTVAIDDANASRGIVFRNFISEDDAVEIAGAYSNGINKLDITLENNTNIIYNGRTSGSKTNLSANYDYILIEAKPAVTMSEPYTSENAGSDAAIAYVAQFTQNDYGASSAKWYVSHAEDANKYMEQSVEFPGMTTGTTVQLGLILEGNINEVGSVTFTID